MGYLHNCQNISGRIDWRPQWLHCAEVCLLFDTLSFISFSRDKAAVCYACLLPTWLSSCPARLPWFFSPCLNTIMGRALALPRPWTMVPVFPWPGRQLKETPIRDASISGVALRGHAQVRLLFMSAKPIKTPQPTSLTPTCPAGSPCRLKRKSVPEQRVRQTET